MIDKTTDTAESAILAAGQSQSLESQAYGAGRIRGFLYGAGTMLAIVLIFKFATYGKER